MNFEVVNSGITGPDGFRTAGIACGIKASGLDLAIVTSDDITNAAGIFTTNCVTAAPVQVSREHLAQTKGRAKAGAAPRTRTTVRAIQGRRRPHATIRQTR